MKGTKRSKKPTDEMLIDGFAAALRHSAEEIAVLRLQREEIDRRIKELEDQFKSSIRRYVTASGIKLELSSTPPREVDAPVRESVQKAKSVVPSGGVNFDALTQHFEENREKYQAKLIEREKLEQRWPPTSIRQMPSLEAAGAVVGAQIAHCGHLENTKLVIYDCPDWCGRHLFLGTPDNDKTFRVDFIVVCAQCNKTYVECPEKLYYAVYSKKGGGSIIPCEPPELSALDTEELRRFAEEIAAKPSPHQGGEPHQGEPSAPGPVSSPS